jgi:hypothetical protein
MNPANACFPSTRSSRRLLCAALLLAVLAPAAAALAADQFIAPTREELQMTSLPGYPGAAAVVLYREEITKDDLHEVLHYDRIKVLTEEGKKYANVELGYVTTTGSWDDQGDDKTLDQIAGRTIHSDGTIIPFTGKPYLKVMAKTKGTNYDARYQAKIFTLPDVEVGSIIEYRYATRINDNIYESPTWLIQGDLYVKSAHYAWYPTTRDIQDEQGRSINSITWFPILPAGAKIDHHETPGGFENQSQHVYDLVVNDIPPQVDEEYMPPIGSYGYRVYFNFSSYRSGDEYWKSEGKSWSRRVNSFANPNSALKEATAAIIAGAATQDEKLRKIYAAVMALENTDYTRQHEQREDKANGLGKLNNANDVLTHKRGNSRQIAELFVGMARAAGMTADLMLVPDRSQEFFLQGWLTFDQFDADVAIVNVDGKEQFFDPGARFCTYQHLAWQHTFVDGLRQKDGETAFAKTPGDGYTANVTSRVANLNMDGKAQITGSVEVSFAGAPALRWRQAALRGDQEGLQHDLRSSLEHMLPKSLDVTAITVDGLDDYEHPLKVSCHVSGTLGSWAGKRLVMPADLFLADATATFPHEKREAAVYFHYAQAVQDALRINFPSAFAVEAAPSPAKFDLPRAAVYNMTVTSAPTNFITRRVFVFGDIAVAPANYAPLRSFYSQLETNDQQSVVLKAAPAVTAAVSTPASE